MIIIYTTVAKSPTHTFSFRVLSFILQEIANYHVMTFYLNLSVF